nr:unnamed protein product [Callosobruchus analis]
MALNYKKVKNKKNLLWDLLVAEMRGIMYGIGMGETIFGTMCLMRALFGRLHYYTILFVPGFISGLSVLVETKENQILDALIFFNSLIETILNKLQMSLTKETLAFMLISGALMNTLENRKDDFKFLYLWFYTPQRKVLQAEDEQNKKCIHNESCFKYVYQGFFMYFGLGYAINVTRSLLPRMGRIFKRPSLLGTLLMDKTNILFGLLIGCYTGLYKVTK